MLKNWKLGANNFRTIDNAWLYSGEDNCAKKRFTKGQSCVF